MSEQQSSSIKPPISATVDSIVRQGLSSFQPIVQDNYFEDDENIVIQQFHLHNHQEILHYHLGPAYHDVVFKGDITRNKYEITKSAIETIRAPGSSGSIVFNQEPSSQSAPEIPTPKSKPEKRAIQNPNLIEKNEDLVRETKPLLDYSEDATGIEGKAAKFRKPEELTKQHDRDENVKQKSSSKKSLGSSGSIVSNQEPSPQSAPEIPLPIREQEKQAIQNPKLIEKNEDEDLVRETKPLLEYSEDAIVIEGKAAKFRKPEELTKQHDRDENVKQTSSSKKCDIDEDRESRLFINQLYYDKTGHFLSLFCLEGESRSDEWNETVSRNKYVNMIPLPVKIRANHPDIIHIKLATRDDKLGSVMPSEGSNIRTGDIIDQGYIQEMFVLDFQNRCCSCLYTVYKYVQQCFASICGVKADDSVIDMVYTLDTKERILRKIWPPDPDQRDSGRQADDAPRNEFSNHLSMDLHVGEKNKEITSGYINHGEDKSTRTENTTSVRKA